MANRRRVRRPNPTPQAQPSPSFLDDPFRRALCGVIVIFAAVLLVYMPSLNGGFLVDDDTLLTQNEVIRSPDGLYRLWFTSESPDFWPLSNTTLWIEWRLWGERTTGYHVTNELLHATACVLLWLVLERLCIPGAFWAALLFAVHPVNVESIAWISQRKDALAAVFFLLSVLGYVESETSLLASSGRPSPRAVLSWRLFSLAMFLLAALSKGSVLILPLILVLVVGWRRNLDWRDAARLAPFFAVSAALACVNVWFQTHGGTAIRDVGALERLLQAGAVPWFYLYKACLPFHLLFFYPPWRIDPQNVLWWIPTIATIGFTLVLWRFRRTWSRPLLFTWLFFLAALVPVMGLVDVGYMRFSLVADHYQHIALLGLTTCAGAGASVWYAQARGFKRGVVAASALGVVVLFSALCYRQNALYKDAKTLYSATIAGNPDCALLYDGLAEIAERRDDLPAAKKLLERAVEVMPDYANAYNNLAGVLWKLGKRAEAIDLLHKAVELDPSYTLARVNLGQAYAASGILPEAIEQYAAAVRNDPRVFDLRVRMGECLVAAGRSDEAVAALLESRLVNRRTAFNENAMGQTLCQWNRTADAVECFQKAVDLDPNFGNSHFNLGKIYRNMARAQEAVEQFEATIRCDPANIEAYTNLAEIRLALGETAEAVAVAQNGAAAARSNGQNGKADEIERWTRSCR